MTSQKGFMKTWMWVVGIVLVLVVIVGGYYNSFATMKQGVDAQFGNVQSVYQRRLDSLSNVAAVAKQAGAKEEQILTNVTAMRSGIVAAKTPGELEKVGNQINSQFAFVAEAYPQLQSIEAYKNIQTEVTGAENRISVERMRYNESVKAYNTAIVRMPGGLFARLFGFTAAEYFQAQDAAQNAPNVGDMLN